MAPASFACERTSSNATWRWSLEPFFFLNTHFTNSDGIQFRHWKSLFFATAVALFLSMVSPGNADPIQGGDITMEFGADGKPLSVTCGAGENLINKANPGEGFVLRYGTGDAAIRIPLNVVEYKDGKLTASAEGGLPRVTFGVTTGWNHMAFRMERLEGVPTRVNPVLSFEANFLRPGVEVLPLDYMTVSAGRFASVRAKIMVSWPYLWHRSEDDPLGGFVFFVTESDEEHNDSLVRIWVEENLPHPKVEGEWTIERAKEWVKEWQKTFPRLDELTISAKSPEDLQTLTDYARKLHVNRVYLHTDTWRGEYWPKEKETLHLNPQVFPNGEWNLQTFTKKLKVDNMVAALHTVCYGFGPNGSRYVGAKPDKRLAFWVKGTLAEPVGAEETTMLFRPDAGFEFPVIVDGAAHPGTFNPYWKIQEVLIDGEIVRVGNFTDTDRPVWIFENCRRGSFLAFQSRSRPIQTEKKSGGPEEHTRLHRSPRRGWAILNPVGAD